MKRFYVWKDGCEEGAEWERISGEQFYALVRSSESIGRYFALSRDEDCYFEVSRENYLKWKRTDMEETRNLQKRFEDTLGSIPLDTVLYYDDNGIPVTLADEIPEPEPDPMLEELQEALKCLTAQERKIIDLLYLKNHDNKSERMIASQLGVPLTTLNCRKKKILKKLRSAFVQN